MATVAKPFKTVNRVFDVGAQVLPNDYIEPFDYQDFLDRGFLTQPAPAAPPTTPAPPPIEPDPH